MVVATVATEFTAAPLGEEVGTCTFVIESSSSSSSSSFVTFIIIDYKSLKHHLQNRKSFAAAKSTARQSCLVGVLYDIYREIKS